MENLFTRINNLIKQKLNDPNTYVEKTFSYLKIYQHALNYSVQKKDEYLFKNFINLPYSIQVGIYWLKSKLRPTRNKYPILNEYAIIDPDRTVLDNDGKWHSMYFDNIRKIIPTNQLSLLSNVSKTNDHYDFNITTLKEQLPPLDQTEKNILREINTSVKHAANSKRFSKYELMHLKSQMHIFFESFRLYYRLFIKQRTKHILLTCHYHNEGLISAMKLLNISTTEIQHGLIARNDIYYVYDPQFKENMYQAMMPDRIIVYGPYWKQMLQQGCEFEPQNIYVGGDYLYRLPRSSEKKITKENMILICAQKTMSKDYIKYILILLDLIKTYPDWKVTIKLHPLEWLKDDYYALEKYGVQVVSNEISLDTLLMRSKIHITIYSTTIYDAIGLDIVNFSLQNFGIMRDYAQGMITEGVALPLYTHENPIEKYYKIKEQPDIESRMLPREEVYDEYNPDVFKKILDLN